MDNLTPTAQATLAALRDGPGNVHELRERTGRSRSATDKALAELAKAGLIVKVDLGGDLADGAPTRWQLADPTPADGDSGEQVTAIPDGPADGLPYANQAAVDEVSGDPAISDETDGDPDIGPDEPEPTAEVDAEPKDPGDGEQAPIEEEVKTCRGCQDQMPKICPCCWQKTPAYCGKCRKDMPQVRRGEPGEQQILSNGLPKLRPGELEQLVLKVMRDNPLPHHVGVTGWTSGRVAIFLPGRSTGAIGNALDKLTATGAAELIGDKPVRYQLKPTDQPEAAPAPTGDESGQSDAAEQGSTATE